MIIPITPAADTNVALQTISDANNAFTFDLYKVLAEEPGNLFYSPLSIHVIMALVFMGAGGDTEKQIAKGLHLPDDRTITEDGVSDIMNQLKDSNDVMLNIANRVYLKHGFEINKGFNQSAIRFMAGAEEVDFTQEEARTIINGWVEQKTNEKIKDIIPPGVFDDLTRMVLVNAIYFKGEWLKQFKKDRTSLTPFYLSSETTKNVDMMYTEDDFKYADLSDLNSQALLLPYKGARLSMMVFLPRQVNGILDLEKKLANLNLHSTINRMFRRRVHVYLPKFKLEYEKELNKALGRLGMDIIFTDFANFTGISNEPVKVSKVLHKAFIEVNEEGTEAAAATAVVFSFITSVGAGPPPPTIFKADHPFLFLILDQETGAVLFAGRYSTPPS